MRNTNTLTFTLRERAYLSTKIFEPESLTAGQEPGQTLLVSVDPIGALLSPGVDIVRSGEDNLAPAPYATALAVTLSRFRRFRYIGTRVGLRPAATTGQVDIAHISAPQGGANNYVHPYDVSNMIHYRRWIGGNIDLPHLRIGTHLAPDGSTSIKWGTKQAMDLDLAWMSDPRFMHSNVSQGFDLFARPMRATVEAAPEGATTMWLYGQYTSAGQEGSFAESGAESTTRKSLGRTMLTGGHIVPDGWTHNPLSCFQYTSDYGRSSDGAPGHDTYHITGIQPRAPWFADYYNVGQFAGSVADALKLVKERYMNPVCILRLPPAYGTVMYYTMYIAHYFSVKEPYLTNTAYVAAHIDSITPHPVEESADIIEVPRMRIQPSGIVVHQAVTPDPQSAAETGYTAEFSELMDMEYAGALHMCGTDEPTDGMDEMADAFAEFGLLDADLHHDIPQPEAVEPPEGGGVSGGEEQ